MTNKSSIRKEVLAKRSALTKEQVRNYSQQIIEKLVLLPEFWHAKTVLAYVDCRNEVQTELLMQISWQLGKHVAVPRVHGKTMDFYEISGFDQLEPGTFQVREPIASAPKIEVEDAFMVMPGVAFDDRCGRIGYGGGYYDRYLAKYPNLFKVAIAYEVQMVEKIPMIATDLKPDLLITEARIIHA